MISRLVAPSALRTPISRVRSVTEIIMMATTPTPPTMSPTPDSATMTAKKPAVMLLKESRILSCDSDRKVVLLHRLEAALGAQGGDHFLLGLVARGGGGREHREVHPALPVVRHLHEGRVRHRHAHFVAAPEERGRLHVNADDVNG